MTPLYCRYNIETRNYAVQKQSVVAGENCLSYTFYTRLESVTACIPNVTQPAEMNSTVSKLLLNFQVKGETGLNMLNNQFWCTNYAPFVMANIMALWPRLDGRIRT